MLTESESPDDFMYVTAQEWDAIESKDAEFVSPPEWFVILWNNAAGEYGRYNENTGYFELNGVTDLTYDEALRIYQVLSLRTGNQWCFHRSTDIRAALPINIRKGGDCDSLARGLRAESLILIWPDGTWATNVSCMLHNTRLRYVNRLKVGNSVAGFDSNFAQHSDDLEFIGLVIGKQYGPSAKSFSLEFNSKISFECLQFIVDNSEVHATSVSIILHPDAYARLTDALVAQAAEKSIIFITR